MKVTLKFEVDLEGVWEDQDFFRDCDDAQIIEDTVLEDLCGLFEEPSLRIRVVRDSALGRWYKYTRGGRPPRIIGVELA